MKNKCFAAILILAVTSCNDQQTAKLESKETAKVESKEIEEVPINLQNSKDSKTNDIDSSLIRFENLASLLPKINGFSELNKANGEEFSAFSSGGMQTYVKKDYTNGNSILQMELVDYGQSRKTAQDLLKMYEKNGGQYKEENLLVLTDTINKTTKAVRISNDRFLILSTINNLENNIPVKANLLIKDQQLKDLIQSK